MQERARGPDTAMQDRAEELAWSQRGVLELESGQQWWDSRTLLREPPRRWIDDERRKTSFVVNLGTVMERLDEQLLPSLYAYVGRSLHASPTQLGTLTLARALVQALASPLAGVLGHYANRIHVLVAGAALWGAMCLCFASVHSVAAGYPFWAMNGIGLSLLIPAAQSVTADYYSEERRGRAFGLLYLTGTLGALVGALYATNIGHLRPLGVEGWRFAFGTVALASWAIGALALALGVDPRVAKDPKYRVARAADVEESSWRQTARDVWRVVTIPSFLIIILQGIVGTLPWYALAYETFYFQLVGMSDSQAAGLMALFLGFNAIGGLLGGHVGDWAAKRWPNHGRIAVCQLSVGIGVPLAIVLFKLLPMGGSAGGVALYALVLAATGLLITWASTACNNPIFAEIVPPHMRNLIFAFDRSFEGALAAMGAPLVGILAERAFGFTGTAEVGSDLEENVRKARSLGNALLVFTAVPWTLCAFFFSGLHWTYRRDKQRATERMAGIRGLATVPTVEEEEEEDGACTTEAAATGKQERERLVARERGDSAREVGNADDAPP